MCTTCGCSGTGAATIDGAHVHAHDDHHHHHAHDHHHGHHHERGHGTVISLEKEILAKNNQLAQRNRAWLAERQILALNLVSSPGAGKTTLLERTITDLSVEMTIQVLEGDQETDQDAQRIRAAGGRAVQINTGTGCHLDAALVAGGLDRLDPPPHALVLIENVGNLVCPALFDLGEHAKVLVVSVTEGEDKPIKYPHMFRASQLVLLNKIDLLPYVPFDVERFLDFACQVNPGLRVLQVSATRGAGLEPWYSWLRTQVNECQPLAASTH